MNRSFISIIAIGVLTLGLSSPLFADASGSVEDRLRESLRATLLQLRSAQNDLAAAQAALAEEKKTLTSENEALKKQAVADHLETDKVIANLKTANAAQADELAKLKDTLAKTKAAFEQAAALARTKEADRVRLNSELIAAQRRGDDLHRKNVDLFKLGNEILQRYEKFGLGDALAAREPFVGLTRVKLENLAQDYADKLDAQRDTNP